MWQQTVLSPEERVKFDKRFTEGKVYLRQLAEAQAEISYKAGYKKASEESNAISHLDCYEDGKLKGMREVVEWLEHHIFFVALDINEGDKPALHLMNNSLVLGERWQAFLKERGIET